MRNALLVILLSGLVLTGCDLDLNDPNLPTTEDVLTTRDGLSQLAVGLQAEYTGQIVDPIYVAGLITDEIGAGGATFQTYQNVDAKVADPDLNQRDPSVGPWDGMYRVMEITNNLLANVEEVGFGPGTTSGMLALAEFYRGMALAHLGTIYERAAIVNGLDNQEPPLVPNDQVLDEALSHFESALSRIQSTAPSDAFNTDILAPGFDLENTIKAMIARYSLVAGDMNRAMSAAQSVDPNVLSVFEYTGSDPNPLYGRWYASGNAYQMRAEDAFRLEAEEGDQRVPYWVTEADIAGATGPLDDLPRMDSPSEPIHAYLPDEMKLIMAEISARNGDLSAALDMVNQVRTQCESALDEPVACLPALEADAVDTQDAMLAEILTQRRYELYLQGVRWADYRRFGVELPQQYQFMPIPLVECERNGNANC